MPIEIKELIIKTSVENTDFGGGSKDAKMSSNIDISKMKEDIINECVFAIMEQLSKNKER